MCRWPCRTERRSEELLLVFPSMLGAVRFVNPLTEMFGLMTLRVDRVLVDIQSLVLE